MLSSLSLQKNPRIKRSVPVGITRGATSPKFTPSQLGGLCSAHQTLHFPHHPIQGARIPIRQSALKAAKVTNSQKSLCDLTLPPALPPKYHLSYGRFPSCLPSRQPPLRKVGSEHRYFCFSSVLTTQAQRPTYQAYRSQVHSKSPVRCSLYPPFLFLPSGREKMRLKNIMRETQIATHRTKPIRIGRLKARLCSKSPDLIFLVFKLLILYSLKYFRIEGKSTK